MSARIFCRCLIGMKPISPRLKTVFRFESVLPAYENFVNTKDQLNLQSLYHEYPNAEGFINLCRQYNLNEQPLVKAIKSVPDITNLEPHKISENIQQFFNLGFEPTGVATIIENYPRILDYDANQIVDTFEAWRSGNLNERFLRRLFIDHSWLFSVNNEQVKKRLNRIHYLMRHKINRITSVLLTSPTIMISNWNEVEDKFMYCLKEMRYTEKEISKSTVLAQSMARIKVRHMFLDRVGVYVRPGLKDLPGMNPHKNPSLTEIIDLDDEQFAINTAKVSPEEYRVFLKLMRYEEEDAEVDNIEIEPKDEKRSSEFDDKDYVNKKR